VAKTLWQRFEFVYTPKHGSWLNMAEIHIDAVRREVKAWEKSRNNKITRVNWQFTTDDARIKLSRLYPTIHT